MKLVHLALAIPLQYAVANAAGDAALATAMATFPPCAVSTVFG
jgi:hypothetical protein